MIAGGKVQRNLDKIFRDDVAETVVLVIGAVIDDVAGDDDECGLGISLNIAASTLACSGAVAWVSEAWMKVNSARTEKAIQNVIASVAAIP